MCVIVYKPAKVNLPDSVLNDCFTSNPNGAGYTIIWERNKFLTRKGFMSIDDLKNDLNRVVSDFTPYGLILHFRIMTSGIVNPINTHPYPITHKPDLFTQTELTNIPVIYHNGILFGVKQSWSNDINEYSDSFLLARDVLSRTDGTGIQNVLSLIANTTNNKFCYVNTHGTVFLFGTFTKHDDVFYSNMYWNEPEPIKYSWGEWTGSSWTYKQNKTPLKSTFTGNTCKSCQSTLFAWERYDDGLCRDCHNDELKAKSTAIIKSNGVNLCASCGIQLMEHEKYYCDDCLEWYTNPHNPNNGG